MPRAEKQQTPCRDVNAEILDPKRRNLSDVGVKLVEAARRAAGIDHPSATA